MPSIILSATTARRLKRLAIGEWRETGVRLPNGKWRIRIDREVYGRLQAYRREGESFESVVLRMIQEWERTNADGKSRDDGPGAA